MVHNKNISKTQKVRFFTAEMLLHIASLYSWNGITDVSPDGLKVWSFIYLLFLVPVLPSFPSLQPTAFERAPNCCELDELKKRNLLSLFKMNPQISTASHCILATDFLLLCLPSCIPLPDAYDPSTPILIYCKHPLEEICF